MSGINSARRPPRGNTVGIIIEILGVLMQLLLVYTGLRYILGDEEGVDEHTRLLAWCVVATLYLAGTVLWLNFDLHFSESDHPLLKRAARNPLMVLFSGIVTFSSSLVGLTAAVTLILGHGDPDYFTLFELVAVWAMLASWALFHWGYARIYHALFHRQETATPLEFPNTPHPRLIDFVYFSFTNGTSFAPSDVKVSSSRMRWTVVWHTTFSFFFNALIIVLTMNTISGGFRM